MSMHNIPLTDLEKDGLLVHGLPINQPSQLSDAFRLGVQWANTSEDLRNFIKHQCITDPANQRKIK